jgi:hypothetical protein
VNIWLTVVTLIMFSLSSSHVVVAFRSINIAYFTENTTHRGQADAQGDYIAIILKITNVSSEYNTLHLVYSPVVFCSRYHCAVASMGVVGKNLAISFHLVGSLADKRR